MNDNIIRLEDSSSSSLSSPESTPNKYRRMNMIVDSDDDDDNLEKVEEENQQNYTQLDISSLPSPTPNQQQYISNNNNQIQEEDYEKIILGGSQEEASYALLAGVVKTSASPDSSVEKIQIPIIHLPTILGREHKNTMYNFVSLGAHKQLSRKHCVIYYRDGDGARIGEYNNQENADANNIIDETLVCKHKSHFINEEVEEKEDVILWPDQEEHDEEERSNLKKHGFFVIESLTKNNIFVGGRRIIQGQVAHLSHGMTLSIGLHSFYFLLPEKIDQAPASPTPSSSKPAKKLRTENSSETAPAAATTTKSTGGGITLADYENLTYDELMERFHNAVESNLWDRKHQMVGSAISVKAVEDAARSRTVRQIAAKDDDKVCRADVMDWIGSSKQYGFWMSHMLKKMELKSFQGNIGKALVRAGYKRFGSTGRQVRWKLPEHILQENREKDQLHDQDEDYCSVVQENKNEVAVEHVDENEIQNSFDSEEEFASGQVDMQQQQQLQQHHLNLSSHQNMSDDDNDDNDDDDDDDDDDINQEVQFESEFHHPPMTNHNPEVIGIDESDSSIDSF